MKTPPPPPGPQEPPPGSRIPARAPYGSVRLSGEAAAGVAAAAAGRPPRAAPGRWYPPRVRLPLLSIRALRSDRRG